MTAPAARPRARVWQVLLGVGISAVLLYFSLRGIHFTEVFGYVRSARIFPILVAVVVATLPFYLRVFRWQVLLHGDDGRRLPPGPLWHAIAMGFMANNVLPLRVGEVVRTFAASQLTGTRFSSVLASVGVERLFDAVTVLSLLGVGFLAAELPEDAAAGVGVHRVATIAAMVAVAGLLLAGMVVAFPLAAERAIRFLIPSRRLAQRLVGIVEGIRQGLSVLRSPARITATLLWSFALWLVSAGGFYIMFSAFGIPVNFAGALLMQGLIMVGIALPSTPGYVGAFEFPIIALLTLYGVDRSLAAAYALTFHVTTFLPITLLGAWSILRTQLGLTAFRRTGT